MASHCHHIWLTETAGNEPSFYIDGEPVPIWTRWISTPWTGEMKALTTQASVGWLSSTGNRHLSGDIANFSIFDRVLLPDEVSRIYQMGLRDRALYKSSGKPTRVVGHSIKMYRLQATSLIEAEKVERVTFDKRR